MDLWSVREVKKVVSRISTDASQYPTSLATNESVISICEVLHILLSDMEEKAALESGED